MLKEMEMLEKDLLDSHVSRGLSQKEIDSWVNLNVLILDLEHGLTEINDGKDFPTEELANFVKAVKNCISVKSDKGTGKTVSEVKEDMKEVLKKDPIGKKLKTKDLDFWILTIKTIREQEFEFMERTSSGRITLIRPYDTTDAEIFFNKVRNLAYVKRSFRLMRDLATNPVSVSSNFEEVISFIRGAREMTALEFMNHVSVSPGFVGADLKEFHRLVNIKSCM